MIIVSQDKTKIINFDNVENVNVEKYYNGSIREEDFTFDIVAHMVSGELVRISKYKTEERAKEVLQEIINKYKKPKILQETLDAYQVIKFNNEVFQMPKE